jgi:hypothetical protein
MTAPIPRDREECALCNHDRDHHLPECLYRTHDIDVHELREKYRDEK